MNKETLVKAIASDCGLSEKDVKKAVESLFRIIPKTLLKEKEITINNFGVFKKPWENRIMGNPGSLLATFAST